jgi:hypothetical protein
MKEDIPSDPGKVLILIMPVRNRKVMEQAGVFHVTQELDVPVVVFVEAIRTVRSFPGHSVPDDAGAVTQIAPACELGLGLGKGLS